LKRDDRISAAKLFPRDYVRVSRALEVYFQTGKPISAVQPNRADPPDLRRELRFSRSIRRARFCMKESTAARTALRKRFG
jgi:tRNA A37 N6-isopentenylltransferase MiaA